MPKTAYDIQTLPRQYAELVDILAPRPIHTQSEYEDVLEMVDCLAGHKLGKDQEDYLEALLTFIEAYEEQHHEVPEGSPLDALRVLMEAHGMSAYALGKLLGDPSLASKILHRERDLSKAHIKTLCKHFGVSADLFIG